MKKLVSYLGSISIIGSTLCVTACDVDNEAFLEYMYEDVAVISQLELRPYIASDNQQVNGQNIDTNYLVNEMWGLSVNNYLDDVPSDSTWNVASFSTMFANAPINGSDIDIYNVTDGTTPISASFESIYEYVPMIITLLSQGLDYGLVQSLKGVISGLLGYGDNTSTEESVYNLGNSLQNTDFNSISAIFQIKDYDNYEDAIKDAGVWIGSYIDGTDKNIQHLIQGIIIIIDYINAFDFSHNPEKPDNLFSSTDDNKTYIKTILSSKPENGWNELDVTKLIQNIQFTLSNEPGSYGLNKLIWVLCGETGGVPKGGGTYILKPIILGLLGINISPILVEIDAVLSRLPSLNDLIDINKLIYDESISELISSLPINLPSSPLFYFLNQMSVNDLLNQIYQKLDPDKSTSTEDYTLNLNDLAALIASLGTIPNDNNLLSQDDIDWLTDEYGSFEPKNAIDFTKMNTLTAALLFIGIGNETNGPQSGLDKAFDILGCDSSSSTAGYRKGSTLEILNSLLQTSENCALNQIMLIIGDLIQDIHKGEIANANENYLPYIFDDNYWTLANQQIYSTGDTEFIEYDYAYKDDNGTTYNYHVKLNCDLNDINAKWNWVSVKKI
ncbi:hypothetical protein [Spiroplasma endosymbiont of Amphibalanus improvisus]|uniref:hypothetical protein n=1 Tax=Spiroplasma endosymbiont of Amphibalanus improvisus TaxID=3066327 RepID=UPI00313AE0AA